MSTRSEVWITRGFEAFRAGTFGNAGQNLYVSRAGVLQRIFQFDPDRNGYVDLIFCTSQDHGELPPAFVYHDPLGSAACVELPADGARTGCVADLNGDGYDDLVLGMWNNGVGTDLNAFIYYGGPDGWSERRMQMLPVPLCTSAAAGDFNGDGRCDLAFLSHGRVRVFQQSQLGFEPKRFKDLEIAGDQICAGDLDGDGCSELVVRGANGEVKVYWGGPGGIDPAAATVIAPGAAAATPAASSEPAARYAEYVERPAPLPRVVSLNGAPHVFAPFAEHFLLIPVDARRRVGAPIKLACVRPMAIAVGDVDGDGHADLVVAAQEAAVDGESSCVFWGGADGFDAARRTRLRSERACDVALADFDGDGCADVALCQHHSARMFTTESVVYRGAPARRFGPPVALTTHDARRVFAARPAREGPALVFVNMFSRCLVGCDTLSIYSGGPDGYSAGRRAQAPAWGPVEALCCDINDDGRADLVVANASENSVRLDPGSYVVLAGPDGFPATPTWRLPTVRAHGVCCADLDRDGYLDLVFGGFDNPELVIFRGTADGFDTARPQRIRLEHEGVVYKETRWIHLADLNNDGWLDLVVPQIAFDRSFILWGGPEGFSMNRCQALSVERASCVRAADLRGSGYLDLIVGGHMPSRSGPHDSFVYIYWNGPDGLSESRRTLLPAAAVNSMAVADFNNDGMLDLYIGSYHDGRARDIDSYIYWNRRGRGFSARDRTRLFTHSASGCVAADFNEDGWIDLAVANHKVEGDHVGWSAVWWNGPEGFDEKRVTRLPTAGPHGMTSIEPGNVVDRGPEEYYVSAPHELPAGARASRIAWDADVPPKTWVRAQVRFAESASGLDAAPWVGPSGGDGWLESGAEIEVAHSAARWIQYRLALGAVNAGRTPRVREVRVEMRKGNGVLE